MILHDKVQSERGNMSDENLLTFEEFSAKVGAADSAVRRAIRELRLKPIQLFADLRRTGYKPEWVKEVQDWIQDHRGN